MLFICLLSEFLAVLTSTNVYDHNTHTQSRNDALKEKLTAARQEATEAQARADRAVGKFPLQLERLLGAYVTRCSVLMRFC